MHPQLPVRIDAPTERRNPRTRDIDDVPTLEVLRLLNAEDRIPAEAVAAVLPDMARLVDETARRIRAGGRLHYFGAGTSGRLAVMDAAELIPTFSLPPGIVVAHHAGGLRALVEPVEGVEDQESAGAADAAEVGPGDIAVGIAASGRTPTSAAPCAPLGRRAPSPHWSAPTPGPSWRIRWTSTSGWTPARRRSRAPPA